MPCQICESVEPLVLDHDHATNENRGYICRRCNAVLGWADDHPERLRRAATYLETTGRVPRRGRIGEPIGPKRNRAAYMREYRRRVNGSVPSLAAEVDRLKRELAARSGPTFNTRPFTPVPKK